MPQSLVEIYVHIVFSTKGREPFLQDRDFRNRTHGYLKGICDGQESPSLAIGGVEDQQSGYGAFSVSPSHVPALKKYIAEQEVHHRKESFQDEFRRLCAKYGAAIDERYVWD